MNNQNSNDPLAQDFYSIVDEIYKKKRNRNKNTNRIQMMGRPLEVLISISIDPDLNIAALGVDVLDSVQVFPPVLLKSTDPGEIYQNGIRFLTDDLLRGESLHIFIPVQSLEHLRLPENDRIRYGTCPEDDPLVLKLNARCNRQIANWVRQNKGEAVEGIKLPPCPDKKDCQASWGLSCIELCKAAGLDVRETNHEIIKRMNRPFTEEEAAIVTRTLEAQKSGIHGK